MKILFVLTFVITDVFAQNINVSNASVFDGEPNIAVNPVNQQTMVAAWMGFVVGQGVAIKYSTSTNGGINWNTPLFIPHQVPGNGSADVMVEYDNLGNVYLSYIDYDNTNFTNGAVYVMKSSNNGLTWSAPVEAISIVDCPDQLCVDRPWMAIDRSGGPLNGTIYLTTQTADQSTLVFPPYHPHIAVSTNGGNTFSTPRWLDTVNYYAGSTITKPMPFPTVDANGTLYASYPSIESTQGPFGHIYLASSTDGGNDIDHANLYTILIPGSSSQLAKKATPLISDPSTPKHLVNIMLGDPDSDGGDIFFTETYDAITWSAPEKVNQDLPGKMQDMAWAAFNENGDLAICWRDRRNASATGYQTDTEIYGVIRFKDSINFEQDFAISSQQVAHDVVLEGSGNDMLDVAMVGDTLYTIWGDVRTGTLNIFLNKMNIHSGVSSLTEISSEPIGMQVSPNPFQNEFTIEDFELFENVQIFHADGRFIQAIEKATFDSGRLAKGVYIIHYEIQGKTYSKTLVKE